MDEGFCTCKTSLSRFTLTFTLTSIEYNRGTFQPIVLIEVVGVLWRECEQNGSVRSQPLRVANAERATQ
jgi:hypothetical protein